MGFFVKALAAIVTADAIDRHPRSRPVKYWYPEQHRLAPPGTRHRYDALNGFLHPATATQRE
jgi:hypothetical protein